MASLDLLEAQARLAEVVAGLRPGEEVVLTNEGQPVARLVKAEKTSWPCKAGSAKDTAHWMAPDFDAPLDTLRAAAPDREPPRLGTLKGTILYLAPDFDDIPEGFEEYLP